MSSGTEVSLFVELDVVGLRVKDVNVGSNMAATTKPGVAILVTVDAGNLGESCRALAGLIRGEPKYAWTRQFQPVREHLHQWGTS